MNKQELTIVVVLFISLLAWGMFFRGAPRQPLPAPEAGTESTVDAPPAAPPAAASDAEPVSVPPPVSTELTPPSEVVPAEPALRRPDMPEQTLQLDNGLVRVTVSSWGGVVKRVEMSAYRATPDDDSDPVVLDLDANPALGLSGLAGLATNDVFALSLDPSGMAITARRTTATGLRFERQIELGEHYRLKVNDRFVNVSDAALQFDAYHVAVGAIQPVRTKATQRGPSELGLDTLGDRGGERVTRWEKDIPALFGASAGGCGRAGAPAAGQPLTATLPIDDPLAWAALKNKFFVQILRPELAAVSSRMRVTREAGADSLVIRDVMADLEMPGLVIRPGDTVARTYHYYAGPKKLSLLRELGMRQDEIMLRAWPYFGWFRTLCRGMLWTLNAIYAVLPNYGVAIILLTLIVRVIFWPVTHKSTESMKRMQEIQPRVKAIREKYKASPQKMNQEIMALYKAERVNPMAGCLPMLVQMPVFIGLFNVLRSAVELRYAGFLWVRDLSEPELLFEGMIPLVGSLNILPIVMAATMFWQQRLTPTAGDPQQAKMMAFMPVMMLFMLYSMPSALMLYWSVSQLLSIVQLLLQKRRSAAGAAGAS